MSRRSPPEIGSVRPGLARHRGVPLRPGPAAVALVLAFSACGPPGGEVGDEPLVDTGETVHETSNTVPETSETRVDAPVAGESELEIIDAHLHTRFGGEPYPLSGIPQTRERLLAEMKEAGVVGGIAHTDSTGAGWSEDLAAHGIVHCRGVGSNPDLEGLLSALESGRFRCLKIYLGYIPRYPTDPAYEPVYRLAARFGVPVVFHTGDTSASDALVKYAHPLDIDEVAVGHRDVTFVIAHAGNPWFESAAEVTYKNPNVVLEGSAILAGDLDAYPDEAVEELLVRPLRRVFLYVEDPTRIMFGSDWPVTDIPSYVAAYKRAIPREHWQAVFHDNAVRVFKLGPRR